MRIVDGEERPAVRVFRDGAGEGDGGHISEGLWGYERAFAQDASTGRCEEVAGLLFVVSIHTDVLSHRHAPVPPSGGTTERERDWWGLASCHNALE